MGRGYMGWYVILEPIMQSCVPASFKKLFHESTYDAHNYCMHKRGMATWESSGQNETCTTEELYPYNAW